jgi:hypothetical protein
LLLDEEHFTSDCGTLSKASVMRRSIAHSLVTPARIHTRSSLRINTPGAGQIRRLILFAYRGALHIGFPGLVFLTGRRVSTVSEAGGSVA